MESHEEKTVKSQRRTTKCHKKTTLKEIYCFITNQSWRGSFAAKLTLSFFLLIATSLYLITEVTYLYSRNILEEKTLDYMKSTMTVTLEKIKNSVSSVENIGFFLCGNSEIQNAIRLENDSNKNKQDGYDRYQNVKSILGNYCLLRSDIRSIYIRSNQGVNYSYSKARNISDYTEYNNFLKTEVDGWQIYEQKVLLTKPIYMFPHKTKIGNLVMEINTSEIASIIKDIGSDNNSVMYVIDNNRKVVASNSEFQIGGKLKDLLETDLNQMDGTLQTIKINDIDYSVYAGEEIENGWRLVLAVPLSYSFKDIVSLRNYMVLLFIIINLICILLIVWISKRITKPIAKLSIAMEEFGQGNFDSVCEIKANDEIGILSRTFNRMVSDMKNLIKREYEQNVLLQRAEMESLQMQINPHFLYNTLDTMNWMARMRGVDEVGDMSLALARLMRYSLTKKHFVTVKEEIEQLKNYVEIQNLRYGDKMSVIFMVPQEVQNFYIPRLIIQPIVENAIVHGVEDKIEKSVIEIRIEERGDDLNITVSDDGVGMTQEAIEQLMGVIMYMKKKENHTSIGLTNVNNRIKSTFGREYGLQIQSQLGAGTKITLRMKVLKEIP